MNIYAEIEQVNSVNDWVRIDAIGDMIRITHKDTILRINKFDLERAIKAVTQ